MAGIVLGNREMCDDPEGYSGGVSTADLEEAYPLFCAACTAPIQMLLGFGNGLA